MSEESTPMLLWCPACGERHIDEGEFATKVHHTHSCQTCGLTWRPAIVPTTGVQFLPGFKNDADEEAMTHMLGEKQSVLMAADQVDRKRFPLVALVRRWKKWHGAGMRVVKLFPMIGQVERALATQAASWKSKEVTVDECVSDLGFRECPSPE